MAFAPILWKEKERASRKNIFFISPHELLEFILVSTKTTLVPLGINTPFQIYNTKSNIISRFPREKISHFTENG